MVMVVVIMVVMARVHVAAVAVVGVVVVVVVAFGHAVCAAAASALLLARTSTCLGGSMGTLATRDGVVFARATNSPLYAPRTVGGLARTGGATSPADGRPAAASGCLVWFSDVRGCRCV